MRRHRHSGKELAPSASLAVDSWPSGAMVFAVRAEGKVVDVDVDEITRRRNRLGRTPVREKIDPGAYFVAVSYDAHQLTKLGFQLPYADEPTKEVFPSDLCRLSTVSFENDVLSSLTRVFDVTVGGLSGAPATLVSLALPMPTDERADTEDLPHPGDRGPAREQLRRHRRARDGCDSEERR